MGYEVELYLGEVRAFGNESPAYFMIVATVDLCKPYLDLSALSECGNNGKSVYFYGSDGNTRITEDPYGKKLTAIPASEVLALMLKEARLNKADYDGNGYRRYNMAIPLLKAFIKDFRDPFIVLYGH